jgi:hypothetical protein
MQKSYSIAFSLFLLMFTSILSANDITLKPLIGYYFPKMGDVNSKIDSDIRGFRNLLQAPIPHPGNINGNMIFGGQIEYHFNEDYFLNLDVSYYQEKVAAAYFSANTNPTWQFDYEREVQMVDAMLNLHYYFGYSSWRRFNKYLIIGVGLIFVNAKSWTATTNPSLLIDTRGEFSGNSLSGVLGLGGNYRLSNTFKLWGEAGLQYGNTGQLDGTVTDIGNPGGGEVTSESSFDFTGVYIRGGIGFTFPL